MIRKVTNNSDVLIIQKLAYEIWNAHYVPIIGQNQVDYMLEKFQSFEAISKQLRTDFDYYIFSNNFKPAGYLGLVSETKSNKLMISKIYIKKNERGSGFGVKLLNFTINYAKKNGFKTVWLTVNKNNTNSINWYHKFGFITTDSVKMNIGNDYIMDDFVLELTID